MTIHASMPVKAVYIGDGATVNFPVPFVFFEDISGHKYIKVVLADENGKHEIIQTENVDFTMTSAGDVNGTLTMKIAPQNGYKLTIVYNIPIEQLTDWQEFGRLPSESIETAFDKVTAILKQHQEILDRCLKRTISCDESPDKLLDEFENNLEIAADTLEKMTEQAGIAQEGASKSEAAADEAVKAADEVKDLIEDGKIGRTNTVYQRNIGDLFYTHNMLKGTKASGSLNGAYQCNGDEFAATDFTGDSTPYDLLVAGKLPSVTYARYAEIMADAGFCGYFALDTNAKKFKMPTITAQFLQAGTPGQLAKAGLPNITGNVINVMTYKGDQGASGALGITNTGSASTSSSGKTLSNTLTLDASRSSAVYGRSSTVQPAAVKARVMIQLANVIDNASSIESYIATLKDLKNEGVSAIKVASGNALKEADTALSDIESAKVAALGNVSTAQETAVNAVVGARETSVSDINELAEEINQTVATAEENIGQLASLNEIAEENIEVLNTGLATADKKISDLTALNNAATETVASVNEASAAAAESANAAAGSAAEASNSAAEAAGSATEAREAADRAVEAAGTAVDSAQSVGDKLAEITAYVGAAKEDIAGLKDSAVSEISATKTAAESSINSTKTAVETSVAHAVTTAETNLQIIANEKAQAAIDGKMPVAVAAATANIDAYVANTVNPSLQSSVNAAAGSATEASNSATEAATEAEKAKQYAQQAADCQSDSVYEFISGGRVLANPKLIDIEYSLGGATLVIKAGSKINYPDGKDENGKNKLKTVTVEEDLTLSIDTITGGWYKFYLNEDMTSLSKESLLSYDAELNKITDGSQYYSVPIISKLFDSQNPNYYIYDKSIISFSLSDISGDRVNGSLIMHHLLAVLSGVKILIPDGMNDGKYLNKTYYHTQDDFITLPKNDAGANPAFAMINEAGKLDYQYNGSYPYLYGPVYGEDNYLHIQTYNGQYDEIRAGYFAIPIISGNPPSSETEKSVYDYIFNLADDSAVMHLAGDETISGTKKFDTDVYIRGKNAIYTVASNINAENGYVSLSNGLKIQWGTVNVPGNGAATVTLPTYFSGTKYAVISSTGSAGSLGESTGITYAGNKKSTSFTLDFPSAGTAGYVYWLAIGY